MRFSMIFLPVFLLAAWVVPSPLQAGLAEGYTSQTYAVSPQGQFTATNGQIHYWTASDGYGIYDVAADTTSNIGLPPNGIHTNGYGDAFGVFDSTNNMFYAASVTNDNNSEIYVYDRNASEWITEGPTGVSMGCAYGAQVYGGQLYVSGLVSRWNGSYGQDNYIFAFDHSATAGGGSPRHDTLIQTSGNSANMAVAPNGDVYYGTFTDKKLYHWTADQIASVTNELYADEEDTSLTLADAVESWNMPGAGNGVAVDDAGHVFFAVNGSSHVLAMLDSTSASGYTEIYTSGDWADWFGPISVDGDFMHGGTLYFSAEYGGGLVGIQSTVPEPGTLVMLISALALVFVARRRQRS